MYSLITSGMTWSYSRISAYCSCPYKFFLTYIKPCGKVPLFFSGFGKFVHELLADYYSGKKTREQIIQKYLVEFCYRVTGKAPDQKIFARYFEQGLSHLKRLSQSPYEVLGVEEQVSFDVGEFKFVGFIDLLLRDDNNGGIIVCDHKSHALKPRSTHGKYTMADKELDAHLRQLYLYSIPIENIFGSTPTKLAFNCYRTGDVIEEPFDKSMYEEAKNWAVDSIRQIIAEDKWEPNMDYYYCKHICDVHDNCEYYNMQFGRSDRLAY